MIIKKIPIVATITFLSGGTASAAVSFTEDFASNSIGSNFTVTSTNGNLPDFSSGAAVFDDTGDGGRSYIGTTSTDFALSDFIAQVTVTIPEGTDGADIGFFGLGAGLQGADFNSSFNEPSSGPAVFVGPNPTDRNSAEVNVGDFNSGDVNGTSTGVPTLVLGSGTHRIQLSYTSADQMLTFSADNDNDGSGFDTFSTTIDGSDNGFDGTNSRIFVGGANSVTFDDFSVTVVPEPSAVALLGFAFGGFVMRRRRP